MFVNRFFSVIPEVLSEFVVGDGT